jgi:hypothetical protein
MTEHRVFGLRTRLGVAVAALLCVTLGACVWESRPGLPITIINDTDDPVTIWIEHEGEAFRPEDDDPRLDPGESGVYGLDSEYATIELYYACTDGDIVARHDDGSEIRIAPPVCQNETIELSGALPEPS